MATRFSTVSVADSMLLMRNLAITLRSGLPISHALKLFEEEAVGRRRALLTHLRARIDQGQTLAEAMDSAPQSFLPIVIHLVRTGEQSGTLEKSLTEIVGHLHRMQDLQRKIRSAMLYPVFVLVAVIGLGLSIGVFVLPKLIPLFETLDVELPWTTQVLLRCAVFFQAYGIPFSITVIGATMALFFTVRVNAVKPVWHRLLLGIPYVSPVIRCAMLAELSRVLATLLSSGIPIHDALPATADATENRVYRSALLRAIPTIVARRILYWQRSSVVGSPSSSSSCTSPSPRWSSLRSPTSCSPYSRRGSTLEQPARSSTPCASLRSDSSSVRCVRTV